MALEPYLDVVRKSLDASLCLSNFDSQIVERQNKPEIEMTSYNTGSNGMTSNEVILNPLKITRSDMQAVLIEPSVNSVRVSIKIKQANEIEVLLTNHFTKFMTRRADIFEILRRKPVDGYDVSFLITDVHLESRLKERLIEFIITFIRDVDKEINDMRLALNARAGLCVKNFLEAF